MSTGLLVPILLGALTWSLAEFALHDWVLHGLRGRGVASREHLKHHARPDYFAPTLHKLASAAVVTLVMLPLAVLLAGPAPGAAYTASFVATYFAYEIAHRRAHTHPPRTAYGLWMRKHHFHHHFRAPLRNHGVTSPVWDFVFRTLDVPGVVSVPQRFASGAVGWLVDEHGALRPEYAGHFQLVGCIPIAAGQSQCDQDAAFANLPPSA